MGVLLLISNFRHSGEPAQGLRLAGMTTSIEIRQFHFIAGLLVLSIAVLLRLQIPRRKRIAGFHAAALKAGLEPANALRGTAVGK